MWPGIVAVALIAAVLIVKGDVHMPRGIRNNNPGNIRRSGDAWVGLAPVQTDPAFFQFTHPRYGVRALSRVLDTYRERHGLNTVRGIISRWAPGHENNTAAYVAHVAERLGVSADQPLDWTLETKLRLVEAITLHENGQQPYSREQLSAWVALA